ncbi:Ig-like domain-containing protein [Archangium sp. Cb G35]|uniref:adventurous gliding motility protein AgmC n=1 Tax=Archangium sp. Cb G35 TaxID=1920190 RepID=UPI00130142AB|nr:Ig-like domain-containing protein [Archangium sp. Cb G35]
MRTALSVAMVLTSGLVRAERDVFFLGTGRDGALTVSTAGSVINRYAQVTVPLAGGDTSFSVSTVAADSFKPGDLIMVLQTTGIVPVPESGSELSVSLANTPVGRWELARLQSVSAASGGATLTLTAPLVYSYAAQVTQVIRVPEYTTVQVDTGATIEATPWDGASGGVIAFLVQNTLTNNGRVIATGVGFRGGQGSRTPAAESLGCLGVDEAAPNGAAKGEGVANVRYGPSHTGRGNVGNGGGGGVCLQSGGAGGGNGGVGGQGGWPNNEKDFPGYIREAGGMPGTQVQFSPFYYLSMGSGGGAGHGVTGTGGDGGRGGGIVFIRANALTGTGLIEAEGARGSTSTGVDAGGGGGSGGTIYARFASTAACGNLRARGGLGGQSNGGTAFVGTGGGGGGGVVLLQSSGGTCTPIILGGGQGTTVQVDNPYGRTYGAAQGRNGRSETYTTSGYARPSTPVFETPADGALVNRATPFVSGKAQPGVIIYIYVDGVQVDAIAADSAGNFGAEMVAALTDGAHRMELAAEFQGAWSARSSAHQFTVDATPPATPVVTAPAAGARIADTTPTITGTAEPLSNVSVYTNAYGGRQFPTTADASGNWSVTLEPALEETTYLVSVRTYDAAGNSSPITPDRFFTVDVTMPETSLDSRPENPSRTASSTFTFSSNEAEVGFECALDAGDFASCTSPATFNLSDGAHDFKVRARDAAGNVDATPATYSWILDTGAPDILITEMPLAVTNVTSAKFVFSSTDLGSSFECSFDEAAFTSCTSPFERTGLAAGSHSFKVIARDLVGNVSAAPASWNWTIDTTAPAAPVVTAPVEGQKIEVSNLTITGTAEPGSKVRVFIGGTEAGSVTAGGSGDWSFSPSPSLGNGSYTIKATATDAAGNTSPESGARNFVVELKQDQPGDEEPSGCGCAASGFDPAMSMMALAGLAAFVSRRRRQ